MVRRSIYNVILSILTSLILSGCGTLSSKKDNPSSEKSNTTSQDKPKTNLTYFNFAKTVLDEYCTSCHTVPAVRGAPHTFRLDSYGSYGGYPGVSSQISQIITTIENGTMPVDDSLPSQIQKKLMEWLKAGAPEGKGEDTITEKIEPSISILEPIFEGSLPDDGVFDVILSFRNVEAEQGWSIFYTTEKGSTSGGTVISTNIPLGTSIFSWDTTSVPNGTYFIYAQILTNDGILRVASNGSITIQN